MDALRRLTFAFLLVLGIGPAFGQAPPAVPALPDSERRTSYSLSGSTCICATNMALFASGSDVDAWLQVWVNGVRYLSTDATYGWSLSSTTGPLSTIPRPITNAVLTFNSSITGTVQITGAERPRQLSQFQENQGVPARALNQRMTEITAVERELWDKTSDLSGRGLFFAPGNITGPMPSPAACAGLILGFDATGLNPLCMQLVGLSSGTIVTPSTTILGDIVTWGGTNGKTLLDAGGPPRIQLKANISYFVNGNSGSAAMCGPAGSQTCSVGSDSNNCLTAATACLTLQHVVNLIVAGVDFAYQYSGTVYLAHNTGTTNYAVSCVSGPWIGTSVITITGDSSAGASATVIEDGLNAAASAVKDLCTLSYSYVTFADNGSNNGVAHFQIGGTGNAGHVDANNIVLGAINSSGARIAVGSMGSFTATGPITDSGNAGIGYEATNGGLIDFGSQTVTVSGTPAFSTAAAYILNGGVINATNTTFSGSATGKRCLIDGPLNVGGYNPNAVFPGNTDCVQNEYIGAIGLQTGSGGSSSFAYGTAGQPLCSGGASTADDTWCTLGIGAGGTGQTTLAGIQRTLQEGFLFFSATAVNFNATNGTDIAHFVTTLPTGSTGWVMSRMNIFNCTAAITTAHVGIFDATGAGGNTIVSNTAGTPTAQGPAAGTSLQQLSQSTASSWYNSANVYLNLIAQQGSAVTCSVTLWLQIL